jgi:predicted Zn-dependent peptidase
MQTQLYENEFRFVYEKSKNKIPLTNIQLFVNVGSADEDEATRGASHFIEHMCFKGTTKIPNSKDLFKIYDEVGASYNASTWKRYTLYSMKCSDEYLHNCLDVLSDMVLHSIFNKNEYKTELDVVIEENLKSQNDEYDLLDDNIDKLVYKNTVFEAPVDSLEYHAPENQFNYESIIEFYKKYYHPENMIVSIVSNLSFQEIKNMIKKSNFLKASIGSKGSHKITKDHLYRVPIQPQENIEYYFKSTPTNLCYLAISFRVCSQNNGDRHALKIVSNVLGGYDSSRLFSLLREDNGLVYSFDVSTQYYETMGDFTIQTQLNKEKMFKNGKKIGVLTTLLKVLKELVENGITKEELALCKKYMKANETIKTEDAENITIYNGKHYLLYGEESPFVAYDNIYKTYYENLELITINDVIKKYFKRENMNVCLVGNLPPQKNVMKECEKLFM